MAGSAEAWGGPESHKREACGPLQPRKLVWVWSDVALCPAWTGAARGQRQVRPRLSWPAGLQAATPTDLFRSVPFLSSHQKGSKRERLPLASHSPTASFNYIKPSHVSTGPTCRGMLCKCLAECWKPEQRVPGAGEGGCREEPRQQGAPGRGGPDSAGGASPATPWGSRTCRGSCTCAAARSWSSLAPAGCAAAAAAAQGSGGCLAWR